MASTIVVPREWPSMADHRNLRLAMVFLLYVAQGIPIGLFFFGIPGWLAVNGADAATLGLVATLTSLPWSLKFLNGFIMDRYAYLPMGRRRAWLIGAQLIIVLSLVAFALVSPRPQQPLLIGCFAFMVMLATTFQDVAIDGIAVDIIPEQERARATGFMFGGQASGIALGTATAGFAISSWGVTSASLLVACLVASILLAIMLVRERAGERLLPWSAGDTAECNRMRHAGSWAAVVVTALRALVGWRSVLLAVVLLLSNAAYGIYPVLGSLVAADTLGWNEARIGAIQGTGNLVAGAIGVFIGGWLADKIGHVRFGVMILLAVGVMAAGMIGLQAHWADPRLITGFVIGWVVMDTLIKVALLPAAMALCDVKVGATQFAIYMAISNLGMTLASSLLPSLNALGGHVALFAFVGACNILAIPILLMARVGR